MGKTNSNKLVKVSKSQFLETYKAESIQQIARRLNTPADVFKESTPSMGVVKRTYGDKFTLAYLATWILDLTAFVNIGKNMNEAQVRQTATMIADEYVHLTIADLALVFKRAKLGYYGQIYDRLDGQIILGWFQKYHNERCLTASEQSINEANSLRERDPRVRASQTMGQVKNTIYKKAKFKK